MQLERWLVLAQVHGATLHDGRRVVLKIQYPGVARSIESDVDNLLRIISLANLLPKGMYIENAAKVGLCTRRLWVCTSPRCSQSMPLFMPAPLQDMCSALLERHVCCSGH